MSWFLAFAGFAALIILHEAGHFAAAKAVGMRVERFALFFPPLLVKRRWGDTEYAIGAIPLGGYVKISGMNPDEEIPPEVAPRAYYRQPVWKRVVVIAAGPVMNVLIAFAILWVLYLVNGTTTVVPVVGAIEKHQPATGVLHQGDRIVAVDGRGGSIEDFARRIASHHCAGKPTDGCHAKTPARVTIVRHGRRVTIRLRPRYDPGVQRTRVGFTYAEHTGDAGPVRAASLSGTAMWRVTRATVSALGRIFNAKERKQISGVVGTYEVTRQSFAFDTTQAFNVLAIISLSLAIVNLFPFLPLDGGHIFWALAEKVRGKAIPFSIMERAGVVGFMLVIFLFLIGLSNDIGRLRGAGFGAH